MGTHISATEPVVDAAKIAGKVTGLITSLGAALALFGYGTNLEYSALAEASGGVVLAGGGVVGAVLPIINAFKARAKVTPTANPRADDGTPLVPATDYGTPQAY